MNLTELAQFLAPILPYLLKGGIELARNAAGELGKKLSADSWDGLKKLAEKIQHKAEAKRAAADALQRAAETPDDPRIRGMVELYLEEILKENPDLRAEAEGALTEIESIVQTGNVLPGGEVTGVKAKGKARIRSNVRTKDVSGKVTGVDFEG